MWSEYVQHVDTNSVILRMKKYLIEQMLHSNTTTIHSYNRKFIFDSRFAVNIQGCSAIFLGRLDCRDTTILIISITSNSFYLDLFTPCIELLIEWKCGIRPQLLFLNLERETRETQLTYSVEALFTRAYQYWFVGSTFENKSFLWFLIKTKNSVYGKKAKLTKVLIGPY